MKKRFLLLAALVAVLAAGTASAQVTVSGQLEYGVLSNLKDAPGQHWDNKLSFDAKIDDYNDANVRFRMRQSLDSTGYTNPGLQISDAPLIDRAYLTTDILGALEMKSAPVKWVMTNGFAYVSTADLSDGISPFEVADLDSDNFVALGGGKQPVLSSVFTAMDMWNLRFTVAPGDFEDGTGGWFVSADGTFEAGPGKLTPEAVLSVNDGVPADKGNLILAAKYALDMKDLSLAFSPQFLYALDSDAAEAYMYAAAASLGFSDKAKISLGFLGIDGSEANRMEAQLLVMPIKHISLDIGAVLNLDKDYYPSGTGDTNILNDFDVAANIALGKATFRLGYLYLGEEGFSSWIKDDLSDVGRGDSCLRQGGLYFQATVEF